MNGTIIDSTEEVRANAKLISFAPEMLEMLEKLIITFKGYDLENYQDMRIEEAEKLIKKATEL